MFDKDSLKRMIQNPKYKGFYRSRTYEMLDYRSKKRKKNAKEDQIIYPCTDGSIPAIVSEELWNRANEILDVRTQKYDFHHHWSGGLKYPFSSKIYCGEHHTSFQRSHGNKNKKRPIWSCGLYLKYRLDACVSPIIAENDLYHIFLEVFQKTISNPQNIINHMIQLYQNMDDSNEYEEDLKILDQEIEIIENKKELAMDLVLSNTLSKEELQRQFIKYEERIKKLNQRKRDLFHQIDVLKKKHDVNRLSCFIQEELQGGILEGFIREFVDKIIVFKVNDNRYCLKLDIYLSLLGKDHYKCFLENQKYYTVEKHRKRKIQNTFTYNVFMESL